MEIPLPLLLYTFLHDSDRLQTFFLEYVDCLIANYFNLPPGLLPMPAIFERNGWIYEVIG